MNKTHTASSNRTHRSARSASHWQEWIREAPPIRTFQAEAQKPADPPGHIAIARLAYAKWEARGCPHGSAEQDWFEAELELLQRA
jgi:hypothetical protein